MTTTILEFPVDDCVCKIVSCPNPQQTQFKGQKIHHPFETELVGRSLRYTDRSAPGVDISSVTRFDIKHDGSCGALVWDQVSNQYKPYCRFDIKKNMKAKDGENFENKQKTSAWIECEVKPTSDDATHWPHLRPCEEDPKAYKWHLDAYAKSKKTIDKLDRSFYGDLITVEFMGSKFNGKTSDLIGDTGIVIHGSMQMFVPDELKNYAGLKKIFEELKVIEGLVAYFPDGKVMKIRAEMFGLDWGDVSSSHTTKYGHSGKALSSHVLMHSV